MIQRQLTSTSRAAWTCSSCLRAQARQQALVAQRAEWRAFTTTSQLHEQNESDKSQDATPRSKSDETEGALSRRLAEMAEETINTGSKSDRKLMADAGFSPDLKQQLEDRIAQASFQTENQQAASIVNMPSYAGQGSREQAAAQPWDGNEAMGDAVLRMLDDSHKKIRIPSKKPSLAAAPPVRLNPKHKISVADRLANARDKTSIYTSQQENMTDEEREKFRKELKDRFSPGARPMPTTLQGLTSLANERIEDAIARGQFRNIKRGKGVNIERDYTASSPFLDTTEYFMNKMIQKQDIAPPWIEKQQELLKMVNTFRSRLKNDWRRHAARSISSKGGSLGDQIRRAKSFALAEEKVNPRPKRSETLSTIDPTGNLTTITIEQRIAAGVAIEPAEDPVQIKVTETQTPDSQLTTTTTPGEAVAAGNTVSEQTVVISTESPAAQMDQTKLSASSPPVPEPSESPVTFPSERVLPMAYPFRDPEWEKAENAYHSLAVAEINATARSYNLMAPKMAQKPYYALHRELNRCYAEVAPTLADEILTRSRKGPIRVAVSMHKEGSLMDKFQGTGHVARVRDESTEKGYGFKQFWRDLFAKEEVAKKQQTM